MNEPDTEDGPRLRMWCVEQVTAFAMAINDAPDETNQVTLAKDLCRWVLQGPETEH